MAIKREEAYILKRSPMRETSLLLTMFSRGSGKLKAVVKGVRGEKNSVLASFEPFTLLSVVYYEKLKSDIHLISDAAVVHSNAILRSRLNFFAHASYMAELIDVFFGIHDPHPDVFELFGLTLRHFELAPPSHVVRVFEIKMLEKAGLLPNLSHCVSCGSREFRSAFFSAKQGGLLCQHCELREMGTIPVSPAALGQLRILIECDFISGLFSSMSHEIEHELERIVRRFLQFRLEYPLRTSLFLSEVKGVAAHT